MKNKKKTLTPSEFTTDSKRWCEDCLILVQIGTGGEGNWQNHVNGKKHQKNVSGKASSSSTKISSFFSKQDKPRTSLDSSTAVPSTVNKQPSLSTSRASTVASSSLTLLDFDTSFDAGSDLTQNLEDDYEVVPLKAGTPAGHTSQLATSAFTPPVDPCIHLLDDVEELERRLPMTIPLAQVQDSIACFHEDPLEACKRYDDPDEMVNKTLHAVFGWDASVDQVTGVIRRGDMGVLGFVRWIRRCIEALGIGSGIFEPRLALVRQAMQNLCPQSTELFQESALSSPSEVTLLELPPVEAITPLHKPLPSKTVNSRCAPPCPGYQFELQEGDSPFTSYPFALHTTRSLPWDIVARGDRLLLQSIHCTGHAREVDSHIKPCSYCARLHDDDIVMGIRHRNLNDPPDSTPWAYLTTAQMLKTLRKKTEHIAQLKLTALNTSRKIFCRNRAVEGWKRVVVTIGCSEKEIPRLQVLIAGELRRGSSFFSILKRVNLATNHAYRPLSYSRKDYQTTFLLYCLGGYGAASIAHKILHIPSIDTAKAHINTNPIRPSPGAPTLAEMAQNLSKCSPTAPPTTGLSSLPVFGMVLQIDEIKIQERLRWDSATNMILGVCREHGEQCALEFCSQTQADELLQCLQDGIVHFASEATVIAVSILCNDPHRYTARPFAVSGTCKRETVPRHTSLLRASREALEQHCDPQLRLYNIASDGDSKRRRALINLTFVHKQIPKTSPLTSVLTSLPLFNTACGEDDLTCDFDWKHVFKRFRGTLTRKNGFKLAGGGCISPSIIRTHLLDSGLPESTVSSILNPNDKQDVVLMIKLLYTIANLPMPRETDSPTFQSSRRMLQLLGRLYFHLLQAYLNVELSLNDQLSHLSAAAHLILALYHNHRGEFIPVQLYFDVMSMIKNIYFSVAKTQVDNPDGSFWIILMGTDGLENVFGKVRTMVGGDANADLYQLANRIDGAVQCLNILEEHPEWGGQSRRLKVKPIPTTPDDVSAKYDHVNPKSMTGDLSVKSVSLKGSWMSGRRVAAKELEEARVLPPFDKMDEGGFDILAPFGQSKIVLVDGHLTEGEREESEEESEDAEELLPSASGVPASSDPEDIVPDLDDLAGEASTSPQGQHSHEPWVTIGSDEDGTTAKKVHKASVLRLYSTPLTIAGSKDRLRRVRGYSRYNDAQAPPGGSNHPLAEDGIGAVLSVEDPALTLVRCDRKVFLAAIHVLGIRHDNREVLSLPITLLHEPNVMIHAEIMNLNLLSDDHQPTSPDWEWTRKFEKLPSFHLEGRWVEVIDPELGTCTKGPNVGMDTYLFSTSELRGIAHLLYERLAEISHDLPNVVSSESFPYRNTSGEACFVCQKEDGPDFNSDERTCRHCRTIFIDRMTGPELLRHNGAHLLHDHRYKDTEDICGFCLGTTCMVYLGHHRKTVVIDLNKTKCPNRVRITVVAASTFTTGSPCTNHPLQCPLCPNNAPAVWKYNLRSHIIRAHPTANVANYSELYEISEAERILLKKALTARPNHRSKAARKKPKLHVSAGHSSRMMLQEAADEAGNADASADAHSDAEMVSDAETDEASDIEMESGSIANSEEAEPAGDLGEDLDEPPVDEGDMEMDDIDGLAAIQDLSVPTSTQATINPTSPLTCASAPAPAPAHAALEPAPVQAPAPATILAPRRSARRPKPKRRRDDDDDDDEPKGAEATTATDTFTPEPCSAEDCTALIIEKKDMLECSGPGCSWKSHFTCVGELSCPRGEWFCDEDCRANAGFRVNRRQKRK